MKKIIAFLLLALLFSVCFALSSCKHECSWKDATCTDPKTCTECGKVEGQPLGHTWADATCTTAKTCSVCAITEGEALNHTWTEATCTAAKTCSVCALTEGEPLEHTWEQATCTEPRSCSVCQMTEGEAPGHTWTEATCSAPKTCTVCHTTEGTTTAHSWKNATCTDPKTCTVCKATEGKAKGHSWKKATCTKPKTCAVCGATSGKAKGHSVNHATSKCKTCGTFIYDKIYAARQAIQWSSDINSSWYDSYRILNAYYINLTDCKCGACLDGEDYGDPYLAIVVYYYYEQDGYSDEGIDIIAIHKQTGNTYTNDFYYQRYWYTYRSSDNTISRVYAEDYSFYYDEDDLHLMNLGDIL